MLMMMTIINNDDTGDGEAHAVFESFISEDLWSHRVSLWSN